MNASMFPWWGPLIWPIAAVIGFLVHLAVRRRSTPVSALSIFLLWWFAFGVGVTALAAFGSMTFAADQIAEQIGYRTSPFQFEVACANLAFAVLGFCCLRFRGQMWEATTIGTSIFLLGAAAGHVYQYVQFGNDRPYNVGPILYTDIFVQVVLIVGLVVYRLRTRSGQGGVPGHR